MNEHPVIAERYALRREIGRGGMGAVWQAEDLVLGRTVAMKRTGAAAGSDRDLLLARAEREAKLAAGLSHPNIVAVLDLVADDDHQWLVMEYVDGPTLAGMVAPTAGIPAEQAAAIVAQIADALAAAHAAGVVHRDVKPSNILVDGDVAKLTDFGIARATGDATLTEAGLVIGSPAYLAPEVVAGQPATPASDVWSLGATLYYALSGGPAYETGDNLVAVLHRIVHEEPPRLQDPGWLGPLLTGTMTVDVDQRWTLDQVREFLAARLSEPTATLEAPVVIGPPAAPIRTRMFLPESATRVTRRPGAGRRPSPPPVAATVVAALLVVVLGLAWWAGNDDTPPANGDTGTAVSGDQTDAGATPKDGPTTAGMKRFVRDYLTAATSDPERSWQMLTPSFQAASEDFEAYEDAWSEREVASLRNLVASPEDLAISYRVTYADEDGEETFTDDVTLRLEYAEGRYRIAGES